MIQILVFEISGGAAICSFKNCIDQKEISDKSGASFECRHIQNIRSGTICKPEIVLAKEKCLQLLEESPVEAENKAQIRGFLDENAEDEVSGFRLDSNTFILNSNTTSVSPLPWVHVYKGKKITCGLG